MNTLPQQIQYYVGLFKHKTRDDGSSCYFTEPRDSDLTEAIFLAHDGTMPDDWIYEKFCFILDSLVDAQPENTTELEDLRHEVVNSLVDVYTHDLTAWLHSRPSNVYYLTKVQEEFGTVEDGFNLLMQAQYLRIDEIYTAVLELLTNTEGIKWHEA